MSRQAKHVLSLEQINAADDRPEITVPVPEWNGEVIVRGLSYDQLAAARQNAWDQVKRETNEDLLNAWCLALGLMQPQITAVIAKEWIISKAFGPVNTILNEILTASGLGRRAVEDSKSTPGL